MKTINTKVSRLIANTLYQFTAKGLSLNFNLGEPKEGYMVSLHGKGLEFTSIGKVNPLQVATWVHDNLNNSYYFGVWTDSETGKVYFDISVCIESIDAAKRCAHKDEIAIWDVVNKCEIRL